MRCLFCTFDGRLTKEHVYPRWLEATFPTLSGPGQQYRENSAAPRQREEWTAPNFSLRARLVCRTCNNGWMSQLEADAKPLLERMFRGAPVRLGPTRQALLARWAFKTAAVVAAISFDDDVVPRAHLDDFYERQRPPWNVRIWTAGHMPRIIPSGDLLMCEARVQPIVPLEEGSPDYDTLMAARMYGVTLALGCAAFQVLGALIPGFGGVLNPQAAPCLRALWPTRSRFMWPPESRLELIGGVRELPMAFVHGRMDTGPGD